MLHFTDSFIQYNKTWQISLTSVFLDILKCRFFVVLGLFTSKDSGEKMNCCLNEKVTLVIT